MTGFVFCGVVCKDVDYRTKLIPFLSYEQAGLFFFTLRSELGVLVLSKVFQFLLKLDIHFQADCI